MRVQISSNIPHCIYLVCFPTLPSWMPLGAPLMRERCLRPGHLPSAPQRPSPLSSEARSHRPRRDAGGCFACSPATEPRSDVSRSLLTVLGSHCSVPWMGEFSRLLGCGSSFRIGHPGLGDSALRTLSPLHQH